MDDIPPTDGSQAESVVEIHKGRDILHFDRVKTSFNNARQKAGIEDLRFHDLRHTFASRLVQGGVPLYNVMHLTGHKSLEMVQRYAHLAPDFQEGAIAVLDSDRNGETEGLGHNLGTVKKQRPSEIPLSP